MLRLILASLVLATLACSDPEPTDAGPDIRHDTASEATPPVDTGTISPADTGVIAPMDASIDTPLG